MTESFFFGCDYYRSIILSFVVRIVDGGTAMLQNKVVMS